ncbi:MAG: DUF3124 domain-containing protein [Microcystaceae cyanobacterium]
MIILNGCSPIIDPEEQTQPLTTDYPEVILDDQIKIVKAQTIYVPAYAYVFFENSDRTLSLTITLSIHNTDSEHSIIITEINYYDAQGTLVTAYLENPIRLSPLASAEFLANSNNLKGGSGANFLVKWIAENPVSNPLVESVMISTVSTQGISFVSRGIVITEKE